MGSKTMISVVILLWIYIIYRAVTIGITEDEGYTYFLVKTNNWKQMAGVANTHWLNTLAVRVFLWLPGDDQVWKLRMLSMLSWLLYSFGAFKVSLLFRGKWLGFLFFITMVANPFVVFYFSLSRGYAAACAFIMLALWKAVGLIVSGDLRPAKWLLPFLFTAMATLANFSAFYFFLGITGSYIVVLIKKKSLAELFRKTALKWIAVVSGTFIFCTAALLFLKHQNGLFYGGSNNLVNSLFGSLVKSSLYVSDHLDRYNSEGVPYLLSEHIPEEGRIIGWIAFCLLIFFCMYGFLSRRDGTPAVALFINLITLNIVLINAILHEMFGTPFLLERTTLVIYPSLVLGLFLSIDALRAPLAKAKWAYQIIPVSFLLFLAFNFYKSISFLYFKEWPVQTHTKAALDYLDAVHAKSVALNQWHHDAYVHYYSLAYPGKYKFHIVPIPKMPGREMMNSQLNSCDYMLAAPPHGDTAFLADWVLQVEFHHSGARVYKRK